MMLRGMVLGSLAVGVLAGGLWAAPVLVEDFATDPVAGGRAVVQGNASRFSYASGQMTAAYDSLQTTSKMVWALGQTFTQNDSFSFDTRFKINSMTDEGMGMEMSFGLMNSATTGNDRAGGPYGDGSRSSMSWDLVTLDYFPNSAGTYPSSLLPTEINRNDGSTAFFSSMNAPFGDPSNLNITVLPVGSYLNATVAYDAGTRLLKLSLFDDNLQPYKILGIKGAASNTTQITLASGAQFSVDSFGFMLWQDTWNTSSTIAGNVEFTNVSVSAVPEPATLLGLALLGPVVLRRSRAGSKTK